MTRPALLLALAVLPACVSFAKLEPAEVSAMALRLRGGGTTVCVNDPTHLIADVVYRDGHRMVSWDGNGSRWGKLRLHDFAIEAQGMAIEQDGRLRYRREAIDWFDRPATIVARLPKRELSAKLTVMPRYDCGGVADYSGPTGDTGGSGGTGGDGHHGPSLEVALARIDTALNGRLLLVRIKAAGAPPDYYFVDTRGTALPFAISAAGGEGGAGGDGSSGSSGSDGSNGSSGSSGGSCEDGSDGTDGSDGQNGGNGEDGGDGGNGGAGGNIRIEYAPGDADLVDDIRYLVQGGEAGTGGSGGAGGSGGQGGSGGSGGSAGDTTDENGKHCSTSAGSSGRDGKDGSSGSSGRSGRSGAAGPAGSITVRPVAAASLWATELSSGAKLVLPAAE